MEHYRKQAEEYGDSPQSTMLDLTTRMKETEVILNELLHTRSNARVLEVGCGNGYMLAKLRSALPDLSLHGIDLCKEMVDLANSRGLKDVAIVLGEAEDLPYPDGYFDAVFSERCLINLDSWGGQQKALREIHRVLKPQGRYVMIECMTDGWQNLNRARAEVDLPPIPVPFHNLFFEREDFLSFIKDLFDVMDGRNFMSSYFFGSRVIYPALIRGREPAYNTSFVEFFKYLEPHGNYGHLYLYVLAKKGGP